MPGQAEYLAVEAQFTPCKCDVPVSISQQEVQVCCSDNCFYGVTPNNMAGWLNPYLHQQPFGHCKGESHSPPLLWQPDILNYAHCRQSWLFLCKWLEPRLSGEEQMQGRCSLVRLGSRGVRGDLHAPPQATTVGPPRSSIILIINGETSCIGPARSGIACSSGTSTVETHANKGNLHSL
jgi:hypothetical protein